MCACRVLDAGPDVCAQQVVELKVQVLITYTILGTSTLIVMGRGISKCKQQQHPSCTVYWW